MGNENVNVLEDTKITDEQAAAIAKDLDDFVKGTDIEAIQNLPSNNGVETRVDPAEDGEIKVINTTINPLTGESMILNTDEAEDTESVDEKIARVSLEDLTALPANEEEVTTAMQEEGILKEISKDLEWSQDDIKAILNVTNRRIKKENFNVYKALPDSVKKMIDDYISKELGISVLTANISQLNTVRNSIATSIIDQFQSEIQMNRAKHDFAHELASIYQSGVREISESAIDYMSERNQAYREAAEKMDDEEKKTRMLAILDRIDQARSLDELKEFAKKCKIKNMDIEKPKRVFKDFTGKYANSANNIYDIDLCTYILARNLPERTETEITCFFIVFCKYVQNWNIGDPLNHSFIYYVLYYCAMLDGDKSDVFKNAVREVIDNIKVRNPNIKYGVVTEEELEAKRKEYEEMLKSMAKYEEEEAAKKEEDEEEFDEEEDDESEDSDDDEAADFDGENA